VHTDAVAQKQQDKMANCSWQTCRQVAGRYVLFENVAPSGNFFVPEEVTIVHIVSIEGFKWKDCEDNVPPSCTCPSYMNEKIPCAGILRVLENVPPAENFTNLAAWLASPGGQATMMKPEVLHRRHRCDLDPVVALAGRADRVAETALTTTRNVRAQQPPVAAVVPTKASLLADYAAMLERIPGEDPAILIEVQRDSRKIIMGVDDKIGDMNIVRTSQGRKKLSVIAMTQPTAKRRSGVSTLAPSAAAAATPMFPSKNASGIQQEKKGGVCASKKRPRPPGNSDKIDISKATYCGHCKVLRSDYSQHLQSKHHARMLKQANGRPPPMAFCKVCGIEHPNNNDHNESQAHQHQVALSQLDPSRPGGSKMAASTAATAAAPIIARGLEDVDSDDDTPIQQLAKSPKMGGRASAAQAPTPSKVSTSGKIGGGASAAQAPTPPKAPTTPESQVALHWMRQPTQACNGPIPAIQ
jgi:hypothetical protein